MTRHRTVIRLSAALAGVALVWACGGDSPTAPPTPEPARPATVTVSPATADLTVLGATVQLTAEVRDQNARVMAGATVTWSSGDTSVATVDASGLVTAVGNGTATITASGGSASGSAVVTVTQSVATVEVSPSVETIALGSTLQLTAEGFDENGDAVDSVQFSWESSDVAIAAVDASGLVAGVAVGVATITARAGSRQATAEITVTDPDRAALVALYHATGGPNWNHNDNWLTDAPLGDWYGVEVDDQGRVIGLHFQSNRLTGWLPPELGGLANLRSLFIWLDGTTGPIPPELGNLANLQSLRLMGRSSHLTGPIPPELGGPAYLESLYLGENKLTGPVPAVLGGLMHLRHLALQMNAGMSGALPASLTNLASLETLQAEGTGLCALSDAGFLDWLERVASRRVALCGHEPAMAYLIQAVQSRKFPVPLVAGKEALLRVFVTAGRDNDERLPAVRASFYLNGALPARSWRRPSAYWTRNPGSH